MGRGTVCPNFVVLSTIGSIAFFDSNIACNYHVGWCDITIQFAAFTPCILPFFVCLYEKHILQPILLWYWSIAFFDSNIVCHCHVGWCDITSIPTFVIMLYYFLLSKNVIIFFLYLNYRCITFQFVPIISFFIFEPVYINYICMIYFH